MQTAALSDEPCSSAFETGRGRYVNAGASARTIGLPRATQNRGRKARPRSPIRTHPALVGRYPSLPPPLGKTQDGELGPPAFIAGAGGIHKIHRASMRALSVISLYERIACGSK